MKKNLKILNVFFLIAILWGCESKLDLQPEDERQSANQAFSDPDAYVQALAKIYAGISLSGQQGPAGQPDLQGLDEGFSNYLRLYWNMQELTTDEAVIAWNDGTIKDLHWQVWTSGNEFIRTMYSRLLYQVALANEFLRQTSESALDSRGVSGDLRAEIVTFRAEARFLRALSYWHLLDLFANPPFVTEDDPVGAFLPAQITRADLYAYVESELLDIEEDLIGARQNEYGRADKAAAWTLLAKLYLNADVYTGQARNTECLTYCSKVIDAGYSLSSDYRNLFLADNNSNGAQNEIILPITFDGLNTQNFGGTTYLIHAGVGGDMDPADFGINGGWFGLRTTSALVDKFSGTVEQNEFVSEDARAIFFVNGQSKEINDISDFQQGYAIAKFKNVDTEGNSGSDTTGNFVDTDFPMFRLADVYLMYAEALLRGGTGGDMATALGYINDLRQRAYGDDNGNINSGQMTLNFILDERARELYWEGHRRTDLIRFGQFSSQGIWPWKGNVPQGKTTEAFRDIMPIPATDLANNTNLSQNPGY